MRLRYALFIALVAIILSGCNFTLAADITPPPDYVPPSPVPTLGPLFPASAPDVQNGKHIYASKCLPCHGETGLGDGAQGKQLPVPVAALGLPETAHSASPARWFTVVSQGNIERYMPPFTSLPVQDRWDVVAYALSLHTSPKILQKGQEIFATNCSECDTSFFENQEQMAALSQDDLVRLVREGGNGLPAFGASLSEDDVFAVAAYLRSLSFAESAPPTPTLAVSDTPSSASSGTPASQSQDTPAAGTDVASTAAAGGTPAATTEPAVAGGIVNGMVDNQSGGLPPAGTKLTLRAFDHAQDASGPQETLTLEAELAPDGNYSFEGVDLPEGRILLVEMEYQGVTYQSQFRTIEPGETQVALDPLPIYESTTDFSGLVVDQLHVAFDFGTGQTVQVFEIFSFSNHSDQAIIIKTDGTDVPFIRVPTGAQDAGIEAGQDTAPYSPATDGIALLPSEAPYSLIAFFSLPYESGGTTVQQPLVLKTDSVSVFVPEGIKLKSDSLSDAGLQEISGSVFQMYSAKQLAAGSNLSFSLSGKPDLAPAESSSTGSRAALIYGAGALGLALIGVGVWMYLRDRNANQGLDDMGSSDDEFEDAESAMDAIIALDDLHRAGKIPDAAYQSRRAELKEQLKKMESRS